MGRRVTSIEEEIALSLERSRNRQDRFSDYQMTQPRRGGTRRADVSLVMMAYLRVEEMPSQYPSRRVRRRWESE